MNYVNLYRARLIKKKDIIESDGYGCIVCKIPYLTLYASNDEATRQLGGKKEKIRSRRKANEIITNNLRELGYNI